MRYDIETNNTDIFVDYCRYCSKILRFLPGNNIILWYCCIYASSQVYQKRVVCNKFDIYKVRFYYMMDFSYCMSHLKSIPPDGFTFFLHIACLISSISQMMYSHFSFCMPHLKSISPDVFTFFILHASYQIYSRWCIHIFHIAFLISSQFHLMDSHFSYCMPHFQSTPSDGLTLYILYALPQVYSTRWIHNFILHP